MLTFPAALRPLWKSVTFACGRTVSSPYSFGALWKPRAMPKVKSIGDFSPAATIRAAPFVARVAFSIVSWLGSNSFVSLRRNGEPLREPGVRSLELDRPKVELRSLEADLDLDNVPESACLRELPRWAPNDVVLDRGVSVGDVVSLNDWPVLSYDVFGVVAAVESSGVGSVPSKYDFGSSVSSGPRSIDELVREWPWGVVSPLLFSLFSLKVSCLFLTFLKISIGKSATPMVRLAMVPNRADAPPDIGSHGPSSVSYSRDR